MNMLKKKPALAEVLPQLPLRSRVLSLFVHFFIHRRFALLWIGQTISDFGSAITALGLPLIALLLLHATSEQIALLTALGTLPGLLLGLLIGVWVDRLPKSLVLISTDLGRALLLACIPLLAISGLLNMNWLLLIAVLFGLFSLSFEVASLAFLPLLLPLEKLAEGNSRLGTSDSLAEIAGLPLAGLLIQLLTAPVAILLDSFSFLCSALCIGLMRVPESLRRDGMERLPLWLEMREGLVVLARNSVLRALAAYRCTQSFFGGAYAALYLIYTLHLFGGNPFVSSLLIASGGVGAFGGSFVANFTLRRLGAKWTLISSALFFGLFSLLTPLAGGPAPLVFGLMAFSQLSGDTGYAVYSISEISLRQRLVPGRLLGRVNACMHLLSQGALPVGALLAGVLSELIGIRLTLLLASTGFILATGWLLFTHWSVEEPLLSTEV